MADERLRELQRAAASGDVDAAIQLDREKMRIGAHSVIPCSKCEGRGKLTSTLVALCWVECSNCDGTGYRLYKSSILLRSYCGDASARKVLGFCVTCAYGLFRGHPCRCHLVCKMTCNCIACTPCTWIKHLSDWGHLVTVRAAVAASSYSLDRWARGVFAPGGYQFLDMYKEARRCIRATYAWLLDSSSTNREATISTLLGGQRRFWDACPLAIRGDWDQAVVSIQENALDAVRKALIKWTT